MSDWSDGQMNLVSDINPIHVLHSNSKLLNCQCKTGVFGVLGAGTTLFFTKGIVC